MLHCYLNLFVYYQIFLIMLHEIFKAIASMDLDHVLNDTMAASLSPISIDLKTYGERKK